MKGLILAGGEGSRLGVEKAFLNLRGKSQVSFLAEEFQKINIEPFVSIPKKKEGLFQAFNLVHDVAGLQGPLSGIYGAFQFDPGPWMVFAVDMPFIDFKAMQFLLDHRESEIANCFSIDRIHPEPLACIYESKAGRMIQDFVAQSNDSAISFLKKNNVGLVKPLDRQWILSVNTPDDLEKVRQALKSN